MKLINFREFLPFKKIRKEMGIKEGRKANLESNIFWTKARWEEFTGDGIEIPLDELSICNDNTLEYRGQKILIYIRDQYLSQENKFHISWCQALKRMKKEGRYERYVATQRKDGKFIVNIINRSTNEMIEERIEKELELCMFCLNNLKYKDYSHYDISWDNITWDEKRKIRNNFDVQEFFKFYQSSIPIKPKYNEDNAPENLYPDNWREISRNYRKSKGWKCEECSKDLSTNRSKLHVHHRNGNKFDNSLENLRALCKECHSKQPYHQYKKDSST